MHLRALRAAEGAARRAARFGFAAGELMRTEISCKYDVQEFEDMGRPRRFPTGQDFWFDDGQRFAVFGFVAA
ncbi:MAG: L-histidine N(alpha)-methyltransferase [Comamonadaceae bacterium]|nr:L-histidine N(alpha)-methyltransferase [Comamonadaceae bacterium]